MTCWNERDEQRHHRSPLARWRNTKDCMRKGGQSGTERRLRSPCLALHQRDRNGVQVVERARFNGRPVAASAFVFAGYPVGPCLARARHLMHTFDNQPGRFADHGLSPGHIVHVLKLLGSPRGKQACRQRIVAIAHHTGDGKVDLPTRLHIRKKLFAEIPRIAAEIWMLLLNRSSEEHRATLACCSVRVRCRSATSRC